MSVTRRPVPELPSCPRVGSIAKDIRRSYPTGRLEFCRALVGGLLELSISSEDHFPAGTQIRLVTTLNAKPPAEWLDVPFERQDERTFSCTIVPERPGLFSFWARFSIDGGKTW